MMILIINTKTTKNLKQGRADVIRAIRRARKDYSVRELHEIIDQIETVHAPISHHFYRPNWARLQKAEVEIVLDIIEQAATEGIVTLPVHGGCLCRISEKARVVELFKEQGIIAEENKSHLEPVDMKNV
jgi:hypothetical protein